MPGALVLGGAGFIGSTICRELVARGMRVTAVDGLMPRTAGNAENLVVLAGKIDFIAEPVEAIKSLPELMSRHDVIVDALGWTSHREASNDPDYDLALNLGSHVAVIQALPQSGGPRIIYLGSAHQYGRVAQGPIAETQALMPVDVQGIHKAAAEQHYRLAAERKKVSVMSLRFGNSFGPGQLLTGKDVGLISDMIRCALTGETITVFGEGRRRTLHYAQDVARMIGRLLERDVAGFVALNLPGEHIAISELAWQIVSCAGGAVTQAPLPAEMAAIDVGNVPLDCSLFETLVGEPELTPLPQAIAATVDSAREKLKSKK